MFDDVVITDVQPHTMLCPLPGKYWWKVVFIMRLDSCHMTLQNGRKYASLGETVVVLDVSDKSPQLIAGELIEGSYTVWQDWFRKVDSNHQGWVDRAADVEELLGRQGGNGGGSFKVTVDRSGVKE